MMKVVEIRGIGIIKLRNPIRINDSIRNYRPLPSEQSLVLFSFFEDFIYLRERESKREHV